MYTRLFFLKKNENQSFFLFGPRGVGKTKWLELNIKTKNYVDLLNARHYKILVNDPNQLETFVLNPKDWVVIDEVQKIPGLLDEVHRLIEKKKFKFILTGSSARKLKKTGVNLLAGRALMRKLFPLTAGELGQDFDLNRSLQTGHLPMAYQANSPIDYLQSYIQTYLKEEVQQEGIVRNILGFNRFLEAASFSQAQYLNISKVASDAGMDRKVVESYFQILEDLLIAERLPHFKKKAVRKTDFHPKFFFFDVGVYRAIRPSGPEDAPEFIEGPALETLIYQEISAISFYSRFDYKLYCWRHSNELDVDLVLYGRRGLIAIEVKRSARLRGGEFDGLKKFKEIYPSAKLFYLYGGRESRKIGDVLVLPLAEFIKDAKKIL